MDNNNQTLHELEEAIRLNPEDAVGYINRAAHSQDWSTYRESKESEITILGASCVGALVLSVLLAWERADTMRRNNADWNNLAFAVRLFTEQ